MIPFLVLVAVATNPLCSGSDLAGQELAAILNSHAACGLDVSKDSFNGA
jgi:hypothetical protein